MIAAAHSWREAGQAGHGGQLINNVEGPKDEGGQVSIVPRPLPTPPRPTLWAGILEGRKGEAEDQGKIRGPATATPFLPTS